VAVSGESSSEIAPLELDEINEKTAQDVRELIPLLGSPDFKQRGEATDRLLEIGAAAFPLLRDAYLDTDDLEIQLRIEFIVRRAYLDFHVYSQKGFLGISLSGYPITGKPDPRISPGAMAIQITRVIEGTAAERGGLRVKDIVVAADGVPIAELPTGVGTPQPNTTAQVTKFSEYIASHRPGDRISLTILRDEKDAESSSSIELELRLGRWSEELRRQGNVPAINELFVASSIRFISWWDYHFRALVTVQAKDDP